MASFTFLKMLRVVYKQSLRRLVYRSRNQRVTDPWNLIYLAQNTTRTISRLKVSDI